MDLERFCLKFFAQPETEIDEASLIGIFQDWIRVQKIPGTLLDVVDYRHVPDGPGVMLITHEINYALDRTYGQFGLYAQRKLGSEGTHKDRLLDLVQSTAVFGATLEADQRLGGQLQFQGNQFYYITNDRLSAPNTEETFQSLKSDLEAVAAILYPGQETSVTWVKNDPRERLTILVQSSAARSLESLAAVTAH